MSIMSQQQRKPLTQNVTISQILRAYGKQFRQITGRYSDGHNGRCAMGVVLSYFGWDGKLDYISKSLQAALPTLSNPDLRDDFSIIELNSLLIMTVTPCGGISFMLVSTTSSRLIVTVPLVGSGSNGEISMDTFGGALAVPFSPGVGASTFRSST